MGTLRRSGRVEALSTASPEEVWAVAADVTRVGEWSHECKHGVWLGGATAARPGARFTGNNKVGKVKWSRVNEIVSVDPPSEVVWRTVATRMFPDSTEWRIRLEPEGDGTRIIQTFEVLKLGKIMERLIYLTTPVHRDRLPALTEDLQRLGDVAASNSAGLRW